MPLGGDPLQSMVLTPRTASTCSVSDMVGETDRVRSPSAVASTTSATRQRRQRLGLLILKVANAVNGNKLPSRLVRIE